MVKCAFSAAALEKPNLGGNNKTDTENSIPLDVKNLWESFTAKDKILKMKITLFL